MFNVKRRYDLAKPRAQALTFQMPSPLRPLDFIVRWFSAASQPAITGAFESGHGVNNAQCCPVYYCHFDGDDGAISGLFIRR